MPSITQQLPSISSKDKHSLLLGLRDYYETVGRHKKTQHIERPVKPFSKFFANYFDAKIIPLNATLSDSIVWKVNRDRDDYKFYHAIFEKYPHGVTKYFAQKYVKQYQEKGATSANKFLLSTLGSGGVVDSRFSIVNQNYFGKASALSTEFHREFANLAEYSREQILSLAKKVANTLNKGMFIAIEHSSIQEFELNQSNQIEQTPAHEAYQFLLNELKGIKMNMPYFAHYKNKKLTEVEALTSVAKVTSIDWWERKLKTRRDYHKEHLNIAAGQVQKKASAYSSYLCQAEWREQKQRNREWAKNQLIENEDGEQFELTLQIDKSNANPAIRRCELMTRMRGFEDLAEEYGFIGVFITLTAPSKYHSCHSKGGFVKNWIGNNPRQTQAYLCKLWAKIRAKLSRDNIRFFGFRVVEPHHDATPHWHLLVFIDPKFRDQVEQIMMHYALAEDGNEAGAEENRFKFVDIEKEKGSATGYIAKYVSKNIDGYALDGEIDEETGKDLKTMAKAVTAWASRWRIRQFQQIGGAPVTVYRELRRLRDQKVEDDNIDPVLAAADVGCWASYTQLQGGALVKRADLKVRISYEDKLNQYEEVQKKIKGVFSPFSGLKSFICTRLTKWKIIKKTDNYKGFDLKKDAKRVAWSSVNNCTQTYKKDFQQFVTNYHNSLKVNKKIEEISDDLARKEIDFIEYLHDPTLRKQKKPTKAGKAKLKNEKLVMALESLLEHYPKFTTFDHIPDDFFTDC